MPGRSVRKAGSRILVCGLAAGLAVLLCGCSSTVGTVAGGILGVTAVGGRAPTHDIEQTYYLGMFDPQEQIPPTVYRVIVRGQASILNNTKFASGWVPAEVIDSLNNRISLDPNGDMNQSVIAPPAGAAATPGTAGEAAGRVDPMSDIAKLQTGRRLVMFGPEGFREAPRDYRLVIVMGSSPKSFFEAIDTALGDISRVEVEKANADLEREMLRGLLRLKNEQQELQTFRSEMDRQVAK
ncbi:MAG: hypothetical protein HYZ53_10760 [Planctomycetes bacterium]|nr:hypothetical protein [Planctomycetota bacterium]